jgi:Right handed beta helix region/Bacterial TSP3 repeat
MSKWLVLAVVVFAFLAGVLSGLPSASAVRDRDHDRLPDRWEKRHGLSAAKASGRKDPDGDRLRNRREFRLRTHPRKRDTDGDRLGDGAEVRRFKTNPRRRDTDGDRLNDRREIRRFKTNPRRRDTDRDGLNDRVEIRRYKTNPRKRDTDGDGFSDRVEIRRGTNPRSARSHPRRRQPAPPAPAPDLPACTRFATTATFGSEVSAAAAGDVVCLAAGGYGSWGGTNKAITVRPADGADVTMGISFGSGDSGFTINGARLSFGAGPGLTITGGSVSAGASNITVKHATFTGGVTLRGLVNSAILFHHNLHTGISGSEHTAAFHLPGGQSQHSGLTIANSRFADISSDGVQTGPPVNIVGNEFARLDVGGSSAHSDAIQLYSGSGDGVGSLVSGNYVHECEQGIVAFDGSGDHVIQHNVVWNCRVPHGIVLGGDSPGSVVRHNTVGPDERIDCSSKSGFPASQTSILDNISQSVLLSGGVNCAPARNDHNMLRSGAGGGNFSGAPVFVGGPNPTTFNGFALAPGSPGKGRASDGTDVGAHGGGYSGGPPSG